MGYSKSGSRCVYKKTKEERHRKISKILKDLKTIPEKEYRKNLNLYQQLTVLDPENKKFQRKKQYYKKKVEKRRQELRKNSLIKITSWKWNTQNRYVVAEGLIKNISSRKLTNIEAIVAWYDSEGNFITYKSSLVEFNPIMPGQTSPFRVMTRHNPLMASASLSFKTISGRPVPSYSESQ